MASRKHEKTGAAANSFFGSARENPGGGGGGVGGGGGAPLTFQAFEASVSDAWDICDVDIGGHQSQDAAAAGVIDLQPGGRKSLSSVNLPSVKTSESGGAKPRQPKAAAAAAATSPPQKPNPAAAQSPSKSSSVPISTSITATAAVTASEATSNGKSGPPMPPQTAVSNKKATKLELLLQSSSFELEELRRLSWPGISPAHVRAKAWKTLCGYYPPHGGPQQGGGSSGGGARGLEVVARKRDEYARYVKQYFSTKEDDVHGDTYRQIHIDIPRMSPVVALFQQRTVQEIFERILYIWAIRHPASGYVQGINDLVTPFFLVFLHDALRRLRLDPSTPFEVVLLPEGLDVEADVPLQDRDDIEADSFWCLTKILDGIQDNYTFAQPGIQLKVKQLEELVRRIDARLHSHLVDHDVAYLQFAFRWMNNLLMRELPIRATVRLWDTYLAQADGFSHFHLYVCAAFLMRWKAELLKKTDFHTLLMFLQNLPTNKWGDSDIDLLVAEAYRLSYLFAGAPSHLSSSLQGSTTASMAS